MSNPIGQYFSDLRTRRSLDIENFTIFSFQSPHSNISRNFVLYKYLYGFVVLCWAVVNSLNPSSSLRWDVYIGHWCTILCIVESVCGIFVATYFHQTTPSWGQRANAVLSSSSNGRLLFYLYLNSTAHTFSTTATILYWSFMCDLNVDSYLVVAEHSILPPILMVKLFLERMPFSISHIAYPILSLSFYFVDVVVTYFYDETLQKGTYVFKNFNDDALTYLASFALKCLLILSATHVVLVLLFWLKTFVIRPSEVSTLNALTVEKMTTTARLNLNLVGTKSKTAVVRRLESSRRHDFIRTEWSIWSDNSTLFHLMYRLVHMLLFASLIVITLVEPQKEVERTVTYYCLWIFYMGNFFLVVSFLQSIFGFVVIWRSFLADPSDLKYFEKKETHVTAFQYSYSTINSVATTMSLFVLCSSGLLVEDTGGTFDNNDASYESSHVINALAMFLDFLIVAHPFKMIHGLLSVALLIMNIVFNYWLYTSLIKSRSGKKYVYEYLTWERPKEAFAHAGILIAMTVAIHLSLWAVFLIKRILSVFLRRRLLIEENLTTKGHVIQCYSSRLTTGRYDKRATTVDSNNTQIDNQRYATDELANFGPLPTLGLRGNLVWSYGRLCRAKKPVDEKNNSYPHL